LALILAGCPGAQVQSTPGQASGTTEASAVAIQIGDCQFVKQIVRGPGDRALEIRPAHLPYTGAFGALSAQERWMKMFEAALIAMKEDCGDVPLTSGFAAEHQNYEAHNTPSDPAWIQSRYTCR
jgi:hypothetical protein